MKVKIYGAGSMGNHLGQASRRAGWDVTIVDKNPEMLRIMKEEVYPARYGAWDPEIKLYTLEDEPKGGFDIIMIGTPPDTRAKLALGALQENPKAIQLEKPLFTPGLEGVEEFLEELKKYPEVKIINGYEYSISKFANRATEILKSGLVGKPQIIDVEIRERWDGIFAAHPWLKGPEDTYLGFWKRGGGTTSEHSHGINLFQHFARVLGLGKIAEVSAMINYKKDDKTDYDESSLINLKTENGCVGRVVQDVVTFPVKCWARIQGDGGYLECNKSHKQDLIKYQSSFAPPLASNGASEDKGELSEREELFDKNRPDDFYQEILHLKDLLEGKIEQKDSPVSLERGLETQIVISAAHKSAQEKRTVRIDYNKGYSLEALV